MIVIVVAARLLLGREGRVQAVIERGGVRWRWLVSLSESDERVAGLIWIVRWRKKQLRNVEEPKHFQASDVGSTLYFPDNKNTQTMKRFMSQWTGQYSDHKNTPCLGSNVKQNIEQEQAFALIKTLLKSKDLPPDPSCCLSCSARHLSQPLAFQEVPWSLSKSHRPSLAVCALIEETERFQVGNSKCSTTVGWLIEAEIRDSHVFPVTDRTLL